VGKKVQQPRRIASISGKEISLGVPLTDSLIATNNIMTSIAITTFTLPTQPAEMGVENLSIRVIPTCSGVRLGGKTCNGNAITVSSWAIGSWVRNLDLTGFNNFIGVDGSASRITVTNITMNRDSPTNNGAGYALDISIDGTQVLVHDCKITGVVNTKSYGVATKTLTAGPNAIIGFEVE